MIRRSDWRSASIALWNYPLMMAGSSKLAPALAAGNCVVIKPFWKLRRRWRLNLPRWRSDIFSAGALNVLFGRGQTVGDALTGHEKVRMVSLTGVSISTGEHIPRHTAPAIKRTHMELGGKAPVIASRMTPIWMRWRRASGLSVSIRRTDCTAACRIYARSAVSMMRWSKSWGTR